MQGFLTAVVGFIFVCVALPNLVKERKQWYAAVACVVGAVMIDLTVRLFNAAPDGLYFRFAYVIFGVLTLAAFVLLLLSTGGVTSRGIAGEFDGIRVTRRDGTKEVVMPGSGDMKDDTPQPPRHDLDADELSGVDLRKPSRKDDGPLPME